MKKLLIILLNTCIYSMHAGYIEREETKDEIIYTQSSDKSARIKTQVVGKKNKLNQTTECCLMINGTFFCVLGDKQPSNPSYDSLESDYRLQQENLNKNQKV